MPRPRLLLCLMLVLFPARAAHADTADTAAETFAQAIFDRAYTALEAAPETEAGRSRALRPILQDVFHIPTLSGFLLGNEADSLTAQQMTEFRTLLPPFLATTFSGQFSDAFGRRPTIIGSRSARGDTLVEAEIARTGRPPVVFAWRIRTIAGEPRVIDIIAEGTSFMLIRRDEFTSHVRRNGIESLLAFMRARIAS